MSMHELHMVFTTSKTDYSDYMGVTASQWARNRSGGDSSPIGYHVCDDLPDFSSVIPTVRIVLLPGASVCPVLRLVTHIVTLQRVAKLARFTISDTLEFREFKELLGVVVPWDLVQVHNIQAAPFPSPHETAKPTFVQHGRFKRRIVE